MRQAIRLASLALLLLAGSLATAAGARAAEACGPLLTSQLGVSGGQIGRPDDQISKGAFVHPLHVTYPGVVDADAYTLGTGTPGGPAIRTGGVVDVRVELLSCDTRSQGIFGRATAVGYSQLAVVPYRGQSMGIRLADPGAGGSLGAPVQDPDGSIRWPGQVALADGTKEVVTFSYRVTQPGSQVFAIEAVRTGSRLAEDGQVTPYAPRRMAAVGGVRGEGAPVGAPDPGLKPVDCSGARRNAQVGFATAVGCFADAGDGKLRSTEPLALGGFHLTPRTGGEVILDTARPGVRAVGAVDVRWAGVDVPGGVALIRPEQRTFKLELGGIERILKLGGLLKAPIKLPLRKVEMLWEAESSTGVQGYRSSMSTTIDLEQLPLPAGIRALSSLASSSKERKVTLKVGSHNDRDGPDPTVFTLGFERVGMDAALRRGGAAGPSLFLPLTKAELRRDRTATGYPWVLEGDFDTTGGGRSLGLVRGRFPQISVRLIFGDRWDDGLDGGGLSAGQLGIKLMAGVVPLELNRLGADLAFDPFGARANATIGLLTKIPVPGAGDVYPLQLDGELAIMSLAKSSCKPLEYVVSANGKLSVPAIEKLGGSAALEATFCAGAGGLALGDTGMFGGIPVNAGATLEGNGALSFAGLELASGTVGGWLFPRTFQLDVYGRASLLGVAGVSARGVINDKAFAACGAVDVAGQTVAQIGVAYEWSGGRADVIGCDLSRWVLAKPKAASAAAAAGAAGAQRVRIGGGQARVGLRIPGDGAPPHVVVRGPGGTVLTAGDRPQVTRDGVALRSTVDSASYVFLDRPRAGTWTVETLPGSTPIGVVSTAAAAPALRPRVSVAGRGARRTLRWRVGLLRGDRVRFVAEGRGTAKTLATTGRRHGSVRFAAAGQPGRRTVYLVRERDGIALERRVVGRFRVAGPRPLAAPRGVRAVAGRDAVRVSWGRVRGAASYRVLLHPGRRVATVSSVTAGRRTTFRARGVPRGARVEVRAMTRDRTLGRAAAASVRRGR